MQLTTFANHYTSCTHVSGIRPYGSDLFREQQSRYIVDIVFTRIRPTYYYYYETQLSCAQELRDIVDIICTRIVLTQRSTLPR